MATSSGRSKIDSMEIGENACMIKLVDHPPEGPPPKDNYYRLTGGHSAYNALISLLMTCATARVKIIIFTKEDIKADQYGVVDVIRGVWET